MDDLWFQSQINSISVISGDEWVIMKFCSNGTSFALEKNSTCSEIQTRVSVSIEGMQGILELWLV